MTLYLRRPATHSFRFVIMEPIVLEILLKNTQVFYNATRSHGGATTMTCILVVMSFFGGVTNMATASRQLWSFARDQGVPFNNLFAKVSIYWSPASHSILRPLRYILVEMFLWTLSLPQPSSLSFWYASASGRPSRSTSWLLSERSHFSRRTCSRLVPWLGSGSAKNHYEEHIFH